MKKFILIVIMSSFIGSTMAQELTISDASYISDNKDAQKILIKGGGGASHNFLKLFGVLDGKVLSQAGRNTVNYTEESTYLTDILPTIDILLLSNNKPIDINAREAIFKRVNEGKMNMMINHPSTWYNWEDWPEYNEHLVAGGARSHEELQEFEVIVVQPNHPVMEGVPPSFRIVDELYRWEKDPNAEIEILAIGKGLKSGKEYPVLWIVKHATAKIVGNTLGHDERAHDHSAYKTILMNSVMWVRKK